MTVSRLRVARSETREMVDREHVRPRPRSRLGEATDWHMSSATFLTGFIAIAAVLAILALLLR